MKRLILLGGPMGVGKTTVGRALLELLPRSALLDGDWCWTMSPFVVNEETRAMVLKNIHALLTSFLGCSEVDQVIFCWVMDHQEIVDAVLAGLPLDDAAVYSFTLMARPETIRARLEADLRAGLRPEDGVVERSLARLPLFREVDSVKLDTDGADPRRLALQLARLTGLAEHTSEKD